MSFSSSAKIIPETKYNHDHRPPSVMTPQNHRNSDRVKAVIFFFEKSKRLCGKIPTAIHLTKMMTRRSLTFACLCRCLEAAITTTLEGTLSCREANLLFRLSEDFFFVCFFIRFAYIILCYHVTLYFGFGWAALVGIFLSSSSPTFREVISKTEGEFLIFCWLITSLIIAWKTRNY